MKKLEITTENSNEELWNAIMNVIQTYGYAPNISIATLGTCIESIIDADKQSLIQKNSTIDNN